MKKSLTDIKTSVKASEAPEPKKAFGAFTSINGNQATIDMNILRQYNVFFATP